MTSDGRGVAAASLAIAGMLLAAGCSCPDDGQVGSCDLEGLNEDQQPRFGYSVVGTPEYAMAKRKHVTRRRFLQTSTAAAASLAIVGCDDEEGGHSPTLSSGGAGGSGTTSSGGGGTAGSGGTGGSGGGSGGAGGAGSGGGALVGLARGTSTEDAVRRALALTSGGLSFISSGDTIVLKPNVNSGHGPPYSTNPEIVAAVATICFEQGANRVIVAERSNCGRNTTNELANCGITAAAQAAGAEVMALSDDAADWVEVSPAAATAWQTPWRIPAVLATAAHVINLPIVKTHSGANFTMALKNLVGYLFCDDRSTLHGRLLDRTADLHLAIQPSFIVMDGTHALIEGGPTPSGSTVEADPPPGIVIATPDPIANDATGLALVKHLGSTFSNITDYGIWDQPVLERAASHGIGISGPSQYDAAEDGVPELSSLLTLINS